MSNRKISSRTARCLQASALALAAALAATAAAAQDAPAAAPAAADDVIVVKGFRGSLKSALGIKKRSAGTVDSILGEDIGKFPDANLAESMQRIPGVVLSRGDGGEGRQISVRGLAAQFTRVRVNGMEASSQIGAADIYGAANNGRSFDFNAFPTEIFSSLTARKTSSADVEEGSLGATVDLRAPKPFDSRQDTVFSVTARGTYNEISGKVDPKVSLVAGKKFDDSNFGILGTLSYSDRNIREVGYSAVDILSASMGGNQLGSGASAMPFCSPIGVTPISPSPTTHASKGASATMCSTNNPRTGTVAAWNTIMALRSPVEPNTPGSGAFFPRIPRYVNSEQDAKRLGGTLSLQWKNDTTDILVDFLYSKFDVERRDNYIAGLSFARSVTNNGQPMVSVKDIQFDSNGSLLYGLFDGVDIRSEGLVDRFESSHSQVNVSFTHRFSDQFEVMGYFGKSASRRYDPMRLQTFIDIIDADNFSIDFRDGETTPIIQFGADVGNPASFTYAPAQADGTVTGGYSMQGKPQWNNTDNTTVNLDAKWTPSDEISFKAGIQYRQADFTQRNLVPIPSALVVQPLPSGVTLASITTTIDGLDDLWGRGAPSSWVAIDSAKWRDTFHFDNFKYCGVECGAGNSQILETTQSAYLMAEFDTDRFPIPIRGDVGVRYYATDQVAVGHIPVAAPPGWMYSQVGKRNEVHRSYDDWMPSANIVFEINPNLLARVSAAKVMSRPELGNLIPSAGITATTRTGNINNPFLEPIRANTFDAGLEWYFRPGSLISVGYFYKDIETYIQRVTSQIPYRELGLPDSLLDNTNTSPTEIFTVGRFENTEGGPLKGFEINLQAELDFLPGFWANFGVLGNYTHIESEIQYILASANGVPTVTATNDLLGLSRKSASGTIYWENDRFSIRSTANYRGKYIRAIPASRGSDLQGNDETLFVDLSASYELNDNLKLIFEAQNLTDEQNRLFIDSAREDTLFELRNGKTFTIGVNYKY
ncbi:TonB-denpendent receptor [Asticcacaulis sp. AC460]|uniref:TonB-dependent receptor n=1 Tax=Asticcacaulis sp. AC460 TaxID=1282360 RepID=UPI0003C3FC52|nr:TonB-dependent receptor [Asticcacaulis sp. AC460]ESQ93487.1 TonB-denpendent receptor [Asticcacaulis sp. AC460]